MSQFFTSGGQSIGASASASVLPMNIQDCFPLGWTGWISLQSKGLSKSVLQHHSSKASILRLSTFFIVQLSHPYDYWKIIALTKWTLGGKTMSLLINMLDKVGHNFSSKEQDLLISWLLSTSAVILEPRKINTITVSPSICHEVTRPDAHLFKQVYRTVPYVREGLVLHNNLPFI